ncbi:MlaD family protein [Alkalimarinus alittae]|uniref:MlaD family protein n=1 Tax=Alkalimarinus alittae TaxID=2961619 RepID=A0ABY6N347_9ALTE|nr:MlaD family protein [Alkalimarinus alittae]UZE96498.1 MlaD family protein [Alkalimarinus alittae]
MSQKMSARAIGLFTIGAALSAVIGILLFGNGDLFKQQDRIEMVFSGSVKGLSVGSSITYRGVRIGEVESINISLYEGENNINIRVVGVIVQQQEDGSLFKFSTDRNVIYTTLIKQGVRAQLVQENLVTGRLQIQLEFFEDQPGYAPPSQSGFIVIPTVPSEIEILGETLTKLVGQLDGLPIKDIANNLAAVAEGMNNMVNSSDVKKSLGNLSSSLAHLNSLLGQLDQDKGVITDELMAATRAVRGMADSVAAAADKSQPLFVGAAGSLKKLDQLLAQSSKTLSTYEKLVQPGSELSLTLVQTLQSFERASEQVRQLAETLQRNPESILTGKQR